MIHAPTHDVVRQMIDAGKTGHLAIDGHLERAEIDVIDGGLAGTIHQVDERAADALDARDVEFHGTRALRAGTRSELKRASIGKRGIPHAKGHGTGAWTVCARKSLGEGVRLRVDDEVDVSLSVTRDVL